MISGNSAPANQSEDSGDGIDQREFGIWLTSRTQNQSVSLLLGHAFKSTCDHCFWFLCCVSPWEVQHEKLRCHLHHVVFVFMYFKVLKWVAFKIILDLASRLHKVEFGLRESDQLIFEWMDEVGLKSSGCSTGQRRTFRITWSLQTQWRCSRRSLTLERCDN